MAIPISVPKVFMKRLTSKLIIVVDNLSLIVFVKFDMANPTGRTKTLWNDLIFLYFSENWYRRLFAIVHESVNRW